MNNEQLIQLLAEYNKALSDYKSCCGDHGANLVDLLPLAAARDDAEQAVSNLLRDECSTILRSVGMLPDSKNAYEVWFRHFDSDTRDIIETVQHDNQGILCWMLMTADVVAQEDTLYADSNSRRLAKRLIKRIAAQK